MEESLRFYTDVFGMERLPSPNFSQHVEWLRVGEQQLHLFKSENPAPRSHHFALDVDPHSESFVVVLNEAGTRLLRSWRHVERCSQCGGEGTTELYLDPIAPGAGC